MPINPNPFQLQRADHSNIARGLQQWGQNRRDKKEKEENEESAMKFFESQGVSREVAKPLNDALGPEGAWRFIQAQKEQELADAAKIRQQDVDAIARDANLREAVPVGAINMPIDVVHEGYAQGDTARQKRQKADLDLTKQSADIQNIADDNARQLKELKLRQKEAKAKRKADAAREMVDTASKYIANGAQIPLAIRNQLTPAQIVEAEQTGQNLQVSFQRDKQLANKGRAEFLANIMLGNDGIIPPEMQEGEDPNIILAAQGIYEDRKQKTDAIGAMWARMGVTPPGAY